MLLIMDNIFMYMCCQPSGYQRRAQNYGSVVALKSMPQETESKVGSLAACCIRERGRA